MMDNRIVSQDLQDKIADRVRKGQETINSAIKAWMDATKSMRPQLPELPESLPARLPGRDAIKANANEVTEQARVAQQRIADQVRKAAEPWAKQMDGVRKAYVPWTEQMHQVRLAAKPLAEQMLHAYEPWTEHMHQVRLAAKPLAEQIRHAHEPWTQQMHQVRLAAKPLAEQVRKAAAPLTGAGTMRATASKATSKATATPNHKPAAKASTSATAKTGTSTTAKTGTARKPQTAKK